MRLAATIGSTQLDWDDLRSFALECERIGIDSLWSAEHLGHDAFTPLARLQRIMAEVAAEAVIPAAGN